MAQHPTLSEAVQYRLSEYFDDLGNEAPRQLYTMVVGTVEQSLLRFIMEKSGGNQTRAAEMLGMSRQTLRKKLDTHQLDAPLHTKQ